MTHVARLTAGRRPGARRRHHGPPALRHHRLGRRRQEHPDRPPALRHPPALRRPARRPWRRRRNAAGLGEVDLSFVTDGLRAEREQGITIDVRLPLRGHAAPQVRDRRLPGPRPVHRATWRPVPRRPTWRWCSSTPPPGCASSHGATSASPRCSGVDQLVVCANKMDLVDWDRSAYQRHRRRHGGAGPPARRSPRARSSRSRPSTATTWSTRSDAAPWYDGPTVLDALESAQAGGWAAQHGVRPGQRRPAPGAVGAAPARRRA